MPRWTEEQQQAIEQNGTNIIVSAGAGSGKTAVLSARTLRKLKSGIHIDELLILTFTKAAAFEMMMRIRKAIQKEEDLAEELIRIDSSYITTFDSFALSIVKKYHYLLNISHNVKIVDQSIIDIEKKKCLDNLFDEYYEKEDQKFLKWIGDFCIKDDKELRDFILNLNNKLDMKYNKAEYLTSVVDKQFNEDKINQDILAYTSLLNEKKLESTFFLEKIKEYVDGDYYEKLLLELTPFLESKTYDEIHSSLSVKLPMLPRNLDEEVKKWKEKLSASIKEIQALCSYKSEAEIRESIQSTKDYIEIIVELLQEMDHRMYQYKFSKDVYEFVDISKMAITIVKNHKEIREEIKQKFKEIMIDEYQDTSDLQEIFISYIANNNVYMVGDIKQSIYRFRNANPYIFKDKYDNYSVLDGGVKIDLVKNFRSRKEVLDDINFLFDKVMDDAIGGAKYQESHRMVFGNNTYEEEGKTNQNYTFEIYNYIKEKDSKYSKEEIEIFIIAKDILDKVKSNYQIFDKDTLILRSVKFSDFVILMDRATQFELYKKIFEHFSIPLTIYKDESVTSQTDMYLLNHLLKLIVLVKKEEYEESFRYSFISVARSYLFQMNDQELFNITKEKSFLETDLIKQIKEIVSIIDQYPVDYLLKRIIKTFDFYEKLITVGNIESAMTRIDYLITLAENMSSLGYNIYEFSEYFELMINNYDIKYSLNKEENDSCKIMTIHKSKGLEFPICYYSGLYAKFNISDVKEKFTYDSEYGILVPYFKEGIGETIYKTMLRNKYLKEEISEKIRLFYVALTRSKEKMIILASLEEESIIELDKNGVVSNLVRSKYQSFLSILKSITSDLLQYIKPIELKEIPMTKDYLILKNQSYKEYIDNTDEKIKEKVFKIKNKEVKDEHFSKKLKTSLDLETKQNLEFGLYLHSVLEVIDFVNPNLDEIVLPPFYKQKIEQFLNQDLLSKISQAKIYKEYEFLYKDNNKKYHGIIDLMLDYGDHIDIIDYKLKNIVDKEYKKQLKGYEAYIKEKTGKTVKTYLYSILDGKINEIM